MVFMVNDILVIGCDVNCVIIGDFVDNIDVLICRKFNVFCYLIFDGWEVLLLIKLLEMWDYLNKYGYVFVLFFVIDGVIIEDLVWYWLMIVIDFWVWNGGVFEYFNVFLDGFVNGGCLWKFFLGDGFVIVVGCDMFLFLMYNVIGDVDGLRGNINLNIDCF